MTRPTAEEIAAKSAKNRSAHVKRIAGVNFAVSGPAPADNKLTEPVDHIVAAPKYRNKKTVIDGITFDSKKEAKRWMELKLLESAGKIANLVRQVTFELIPKQPRNRFGKIERAVNYVCDFSYDDYRLGLRVIEDCKGMRTPAYIIKRKLLLWIHGIAIKEI